MLSPRSVSENAKVGKELRTYWGKWTKGQVITIYYNEGKMVC